MENSNSFPKRMVQMDKPFFFQKQWVHLQYCFFLSGLELRNSQNSRASTFLEGETICSWKNGDASIFLWCLKAENRLNGVDKGKVQQTRLNEENSILSLFKKIGSPKALSCQYFFKGNTFFCKWRGLHLR